MKRLPVLVCGVFLLTVRLYAAEPVCEAITLPASVEAASDEFTLADLLPADVCPQMYRAAAKVSLGPAPHLGSVRVLEGRRMGRLIEELENQLAAATKVNLSLSDLTPPNKNQNAAEKFPEHIVVRRAGAMKSCADIERFVAASSSVAQVFAGREPERSAGLEDFNCAAVRSVPASADLELTKTTWNPGLKRWEFALRCVRSEQCVPFLVWARGAEPHPELQTEPQVRNVARPKPARPLKTARQDAGHDAIVKRGQTAMLTWEQGGIRVVLPVTCLEAGAAGQFVLVRFQNAPRILRAEVVGAGELRVSL